MKKTVNKVYVTVGLPASGKTTFAKDLVKNSNGRVKRINKDDLRALIDCSIWSKDNEKFILKARDAFIAQALKHNYDVVIDDTNLAPKHLEAIRTIALQFGAEVLIQDFTHVPLEECIRRDKQRQNYVGEDVIKDMHKRFLEKKTVQMNQNVQYVPGLPDALIVDIDGTIAIMNGRSPYDESKADTDVINKPIVDIVKQYHSIGHKIILCSGRDSGRGLEATKKWLAVNSIPHDALYLRASGDTRKDSIVKNEIYNRYIKGKYNISFVLDDRQQVVDEWRNLGLTCLQVAPGDF